MFVFEVGYRGGTSVTATFDVGVLVSQGRRNAWGFTVGYLASEKQYADTNTSYLDARGAYKARYRRYVGDGGFALDVGAGGGKYGASGELALGYRDIIAISAGVNTFATDNGDTDAAANVGVRLGTTGILAALYGLAALGGR